MSQSELSLSGKNEEELLAAFHAGVEKVQGAITAEILEAQSQGNFERMTELSLSLQQQIEELQVAYDQQLAFLNEGVSQSPYQFPCKVALDQVVYDGDRDGFIEFEKDPDIQRAVAEYEENHGTYNSRRRLLKTSLKLTPKMAPNIYDIGDRCKKILGMDVKLEFYVYQDDRFNASVYPPSNDSIYIILSSGLMERFKDDEITFVIGHELGHTLFNHHRYPGQALMEIAEGYLSPMHAIKLFSWGRSAELSADRIGLLCCGNFKTAASAFFKLSSGVTSDSLQFRLDEYVNQFVDLSAEMDDDQIDPQDWYSTHPFSPLRIKALEIFNRSETYHRLSGNAPDFNITEEQMEQEIAQFMSLMEPAHLDQNAEIGDDIHTFMFLAGYLIAMTDGSVDDVEIQALGRIVKQDIFGDCLGKVNSASEEELQNQVAEASEKLNTYLSPMQKLNIIRDLSLIATADGELHVNEMNTLYGICRLLLIHPDFVDQVIHDSQQDFD